MSVASGEGLFLSRGWLNAVRAVGQAQGRIRQWCLAGRRHREEEWRPGPHAEHTRAVDLRMQSGGGREYIGSGGRCGRIVLGLGDRRRWGGLGSRDGTKQSREACADRKAERGILLIDHHKTGLVVISTDGSDLYGVILSASRLTGRLHPQFLQQGQAEECRAVAGGDPEPRADPDRRMR